MTTPSPIYKPFFGRRLEQAQRVVVAVRALYAGAKPTKTDIGILTQLTQSYFVSGSPERFLPSPTRLLEFERRRPCLILCRNTTILWSGDAWVFYLNHAKVHRCSMYRYELPFWH